MDFYQINLAAFVLGNGSMVYRQYRQDKRADLSERIQGFDAENNNGAGDGGHPAKVDTAPTASSAKQFTNIFFPVYVLVWGADWLQGPFIYTLYKDEKKLPEEIVARLFTTGFLAGAISALFVGSLADRFGRKNACLAYCAITSLSCLSVLSNNITILFAGRALGGLGTTLMYTVFEAWMVTEYNQRALEGTSLKLSSIFGRMITLSSVVAVLAGLVGQVFVSWTGTNCAPFVASICCLAPASFIIARKWSENFGDSGSAPKEKKDSLKLLLGVDKQVLTLGLTSCCFEGSMYLFIFFWSPALKSSHLLAHQHSALPFGIIFASFMGAMMLGSMLFTKILTDKRWMTCRELLQTVVVLASGSLLCTVFFRSEYVTFWLFCVFELCVGMYFPAMGYQKGKVVGDGERAHIYGLLRIPFNIFVVVALSLTKEGDAYRETIFMTCSGLLLIVGAVVGVFLHD
ncbi:MAG: hypothetical protein L6R36_008788 [Xanthoria steineri]|nr:MAG: hypothetical protein L6R36_008788 [Xanthoria steineri]